MANKTIKFAELLAIEIESELGVSELAALEAVKKYAIYERDPIGFIETVLGMHLTEEQCAIALSVRDNRETNVQASHGVGKTALAAALVIWFVLALKGMAITTAPTARQVRKLLWGEIRKHYARSRLPGTCLMTEFRLAPKVEAIGFTASDTNKNAFQGVHEDRLLVVQDEACGISPEIDEGAASCVTGARNRMLRIGNPVQGGTPFERSCRQTHIRIPVWNHPNVRWAYAADPTDGIHRLKPEVSAAIVRDDEVIEQTKWPDWCQRDLIPGAVSVSWIEDVRAKYGERSAYWQARVEGYFPEDEGASIIPRSWWNAARARYDADPGYWESMAAPHPRRYGLDVGDGGDAHALAYWQGPVLYGGKSHPTLGDREDVPRAAGLLARELLQNPGASGAVDRGGVGAGALGILLEQGHLVRGVFWGDAAKEKELYHRLKTEQFWQLREAFRKGEVAIAPFASEEEAQDDFAGIYYEQPSSGQIRIEDKAKTRKRLSRSPNLADAIVLAYHCTPIETGHLSTGARDSTNMFRKMRRR